MPNIYVPLDERAIDLLRQLARREYRDTKAQASVLIREGLRRAGMDPDTRETAAAVSQREREPGAPP